MITVNDGKWHNILFTVSRDEDYSWVKLYIDNRPQGSFELANVKGSLESHAPLRIGKDPVKSSYNFEGSIDNLYIDKYFHSNDGCAEIAQLYYSYNDTYSGEWTDFSLESTTRDERYSQYYWFTRETDEIVTIDLTSSVDTYLILRRDTIDGAMIASDDDGSSGYNSRIIHELTAGTYIIDATTFSKKKKGSFELTIDYPC